MTETRGFSQESLDMLKTDEGQANAVFACFGSAAQHAQMFEEGLVKFLVVYNLVSFGSVTLEDLDSISVGLKKKTMGALIDKLNKKITFPITYVPNAFDDALKSRNFLMHYFFLERREKLGTMEGRMELLAELVSRESECERARVMINAMRIALCEAMNIEADYPHQKLSG